MSLYEVLQVEPTASQLQIRKKFFEKIKAIHPDKNGEADSHQVQCLIEAYKTLSDEEKRKSYDAQLRQNCFFESKFQERELSVI